MGDDKRSQAAGADRFAQQIDDAPPGGGVQPRRRLVDQQRLGRRRQGAGQRRALAHAAAEMRRLERAVVAGAQADAPQQRRGVGFAAGAAVAGPKRRGQGDIVQHAAVLQQGVVLEQHADAAGLARRAPVGRKGRQIAEDAGLAAVGRIEAEQQAHRHGFACAAAAEHDDAFAAFDPQIGAAQRLFAAIALPDVLQFEDRNGGRSGGLRHRIGWHRNPFPESTGAIWPRLAAIVKRQGGAAPSPRCLRLACGSRSASPCPGLRSRAWRSRLRFSKNARRERPR